MKLTTMLRDLTQSLVSEPATKPFPNPDPSEPERLRGALHWNPANCTGCQLCVKDCPSNALKLFVIDKATQQFVMRYDLGKCTFCGQCVVNCRFDCLEMAQTEWALSDQDKEMFTIFYGDEENVNKLMAGAAPEDSGTEE